MTDIAIRKASLLAWLKLMKSLVIVLVRTFSIIVFFCHQRFLTGTPITYHTYHNAIYRLNPQGLVPLQLCLVINTNKTGVFLYGNASCCKLSNKCDMTVCISVCLLWQGRQTAAWMIHKSRGVTHITILQARFLASRAWAPTSWHTTPTEMSLWQCWWHPYTGMKGTKPLRRKWQLALSSHATFLKQI